MITKAFTEVNGKMLRAFEFNHITSLKNLKIIIFDKF